MIRNFSLPYQFTPDTKSRKNLIKQAEQATSLAEQDIESWKINKLNQRTSQLMQQLDTSQKIRNYFNASEQSSPRTQNQSVDYRQNKFQQPYNDRNQMRRSRVSTQIPQSNKRDSISNDLQMGSRYSDKVNDVIQLKQKMKELDQRYNEQIQNERKAFLNEFDQIISRMTSQSYNNQEQDPDYINQSRLFETVETIPGSPQLNQEFHKSKDKKEMKNQLEEIQNQTEMAKKEYQIIVENLENLNFEKLQEKEMLIQQIQLKDDMIKNLQTQTNYIQRLNSDLENENCNLKNQNTKLQKQLDDLLLDQKTEQRNLQSKRLNDQSHFQVLEQSQQLIFQERMQYETQIQKLNNLIAQQQAKTNELKLFFEQEIETAITQKKSYEIEIQSLRKRLKETEFMKQNPLENDQKLIAYKQKLKMKQQKILQQYASTLKSIKQHCFEIKIDLIRKQKQASEMFQVELQILTKKFQMTQLKLLSKIKTMRKKIEKLKKKSSSKKSKSKSKASPQK